MNWRIERNFVVSKFSVDNAVSLYLSDFGKKYIDRIELDILKRDKQTMPQTGETISSTIKRISPDVKINSILEIGCGIGHNLKILENKYPNASFTGIDIQKYAIERGKKLYPKFNFICESADDFLEKPNKFDLIFTRMFLIHIHPKKIENIIKKIALRSNYLASIEYFSNFYKEIIWRGNPGAVWKTDF